MTLSDLVVRQAKATGKAHPLPDMDGLSLAETAAGNRIWHCRYHWLGKQKRAAVKLAGENTFDAIYRRWLAHREPI